MKPMNFPGAVNRRRQMALLTAERRLVFNRDGSPKKIAAEKEVANLRKTIVTEEDARAIRTKKARG